MAAVVSGDGREVQGTGLSWCRDERPQEALEGQPGFMFSQSSTEQTSQDDNVTRMDLSNEDAASTRPVTAKYIEQQLVLVNTLNKSKAPLKILAAVPDFKSRGKFIFRPVYICLYTHTCVFVYTYIHTQ